MELSNHKLHMESNYVLTKMDFSINSVVCYLKYCTRPQCYAKNNVCGILKAYAIKSLLNMSLEVDSFFKTCIYPYPALFPLFV